MTRFQSNSAFSTNIIEMPGSQDRVIVTDIGGAWSGLVKKRLEALIQLRPGWDGYQATPVSFENATFALRVLEGICRHDTSTPQIVPGTSGDLQIEWHTMKGDIELHVSAPYEVHAWRVKSGSESEEKELFLTNDFAEIAQWVREIMEPPIAAHAAAA